jgi:DNA-binding beta-propeller fold protein YncE
MTTSGGSGIAVDSVGNVYVADTGNGRIQKFDTNGTFLKEIVASGTLQGPFGVAVDASGNVYVTDTGNNSIQKFDANGISLDQWGAAGADNGNFDSPQGISLDSSGNIYVADYNNNRIQKFAPDGSFIAAWGSVGSSAGQFNSPLGVAVDNTGNVFVADYRNNGNSRIQKFYPSPIEKTNQTISAITFTPNALAVGGTTTVSATGGASGNPVTFTSTTPLVCSVSGINGSTVTGLAAGTSP